MIKTFCDECEEEIKNGDGQPDGVDLYRSLSVSVELTNSLKFSGRLTPDKDSPCLCKSCRGKKMAEKGIGVLAASFRLPYRDAIVLKINN